MNNYNFYFTNPNKVNLLSKPDKSPRLQPRITNTNKWSTIADSQDSAFKFATNNNYFKYTNPQKENNDQNNNSSSANASNKNSLSNDMIMARSLTYDFRFKTEFVDSKLNLATALGAKTAIETTDTSKFNSKKAFNDEPSDPAEEANINKELKNIFQKDNSDGQLDFFAMIEQPKLTAEEEVMVIKSKKKCDDWFDRHFLYSNTSSPVSDLNEF